MPCLVIGAGLAGLSAAYFLKKKGHTVTIYYSGEPYASNVFSGILYRYPGRWGKKSKYADEAYALSMSLISEVEEKLGIKVIISRGVIKKFAPRLKKFIDVKMLDGDAYIDDAITVNMREYTSGLRQLIGEDAFIQKKINVLPQFDGNIIVASGYGIKNMLSVDGLMYRKGHQYKGKKTVGTKEYGSIVGRGHISYLNKNEICLGSTYETEFSSDDIDKEYAEKEINKKIEPWHGNLGVMKEKQFVSGVRVGQDSTYLPLVKYIKKNTYVYTGLGSRGLLYHAYYGRKLSDLISL